MQVRCSITYESTCTRWGNLSSSPCSQQGHCSPKYATLFCHSALLFGDSTCDPFGLKLTTLAFMPTPQLFRSPIELCDNDYWAFYVCLIAYSTAQTLLFSLLYYDTAQNSSHHFFVLSSSCFRHRGGFKRSNEVCCRQLAAVCIFYVPGLGTNMGRGCLGCHPQIQCGLGAVGYG